MAETLITARIVVSPGLHLRYMRQGELMTLTPAEIVALVVTALTAIGAFLKVFGDLAKLRADTITANIAADAAAKATKVTADAAATKVEVETAREMIEALQQDNVRLREQMREVENYWKRRVNELEQEVSRLRQIMKQCGVDPNTPLLRKEGK